MEAGLMMPTYEHLKSEFIELIPQILKSIDELTGGDRGYCYTASELARQIFAEYGVDCQVVFVQGVIENDVSKKLRSEVSVESPEFMEMLKSNGGWTIGVGIGKDANGYPHFHAVLWFPETKEILDMAVKQFHRPKHNIYMPDWFYGSYDEYFQMYSDGFPHRLCQFPEFKQMFKPFIDTDSRCKKLIRKCKEQMKRKMGENKYDEKTESRAEQG